MNESRLELSDMDQSNSLIAPPAEFMVNSPEQQLSTPVVIYDSESDNDSEPSSSMDIESNSNKTANNRANARARQEKIASLELRMKRAREKPNPWKCSICSNEFRTLENLRNHVKENHKKYAYNCERCPYFSKLVGNMRAHERIHDNMERKYMDPGVHSCELCHVWMVTMAFSKHLRVCHGE